MTIFLKLKNISQSILKPIGLGKYNDSSYAHVFFSHYIKHNNNLHHTKTLNKKISNIFSDNDSPTEILIKSILLSIECQIEHVHNTCLFKGQDGSPQYITPKHLKQFIDMHRKSKPFFENHTIPEFNHNKTTTNDSYGFYLMEDKELNNSKKILNYLINQEELFPVVEKIYKKYFSNFGLLVKTLFLLPHNNELFTLIQKLQKHTNKNDYLFLEKLNENLLTNPVKAFSPNPINNIPIKDLNPNFTQINSLKEILSNNKFQKTLLTTLEISKANSQNNDFLTKIYDSHISIINKISSTNNLDAILVKKPTIANKTKLHKI